MKRHSYRYQRTIARPVHAQGVGFLTGAMVHIRFLPASPSTGVVFVRTDLGPDACVTASIAEVTGTRRRTTLGHAPVQVGLVEHVLAALAGLRIDNCYVELDAPEPPGLDGSALLFVELLHAAGAVLQPARRHVWNVDAPVIVRQNGATLALHPSERDELRVTYILNYGMGSSIDRQMHTQVVTPQTFAADLAGCRTFLLESEALELKHQGLGARTTLADLLVFGPNGPIDNRLRFANEPARHKILDILGDLSLLGHDLRGHLVAYRSGHQLNVELAKLLARSLNQKCRVPYRMAA